MNITQSDRDKLNMLAAGMLTALVAHTLLCVAAIPNIIGEPHGTLAVSLLKGVRVLWNIAGIAAGAYATTQAVGLINGRSYEKARIAAFSAVLLPLLGSPGAVTAFALVPLGIIAAFMMKQPEWLAAFGITAADSTQQVSEA